MKGILAAVVGGGLLWGIWVLLWRSTAFPVLVSGIWCPLLFTGLVWKGKVGQGIEPGVWFRLDLWFFFFALFLFGVLKGVARTGLAIVSGQTNPGIIAVPLRVRSDLSRLLLILAITASPGTIALLAEGEILYIHCLHLPPRPHLPEVEALQGVLMRLAG